MIESAIVNSIGLAFDIGDVVLLFKYGLPEDVRRSGASYLLINDKPDVAEIEKAKTYDRLGRTGLWLLIGGFALQLVSNWL